MKKTFAEICLMLLHLAARVLGGWDVYLKMIIGLMAIDFVTGSFQIKLDGWDKEKFAIGFFKKLMYIASIASLVLIEPVLEVEYLREFACIYWGILEFKSISATGERFGVQPLKIVHDFLDAAIKKLNVFK